MQHYIKITSSLYYGEACYEVRDLSLPLSAWATHSSKETLQRWRAVGDTASDLTAPGIEPNTFRADSHVFNQFTNYAVEILLSVHDARRVGGTIA